MTPPITNEAEKQGSEEMHTAEWSRFPVRKNPRLKGYDYSSTNYYFVTICTHEKKRIFGEPEKLNALGKIAEAAFLEIEKHFAGVFVDKYVVMPNHVHGILAFQAASKTLSVVMGQYKAYVTKKIHEIMPSLIVWQTSFYDHVIRDQKGYERIWQYIEDNHQKWKEDCYFLAEDL